MGGDLPNGMSQPARRALAAAGIKTLEDAARFSEKELKALHGMGPRAVRALRAALREHDMNFAEKDNNAG